MIEVCTRTLTSMSLINLPFLFKKLDHKAQSIKQCSLTLLVTNVGTGDETVLNEADVPIIDTAVSNQPGWYDGALTPEMLTAGTASGGKDSCQVGFTI